MCNSIHCLPRDNTCCQGQQYNQDYCVLLLKLCFLMFFICDIVLVSNRKPARLDPQMGGKIQSSLLACKTYFPDATLHLMLHPEENKFIRVLSAHDPI